MEIFFVAPQNESNKKNDTNDQTYDQCCGRDQ
jgi:hypothetical protein